MKRLKDKEEFELKKEYDFSKGIRGRFYRPQKYQHPCALMMTFCSTSKNLQVKKDRVPDLNKHRFKRIHKDSKKSAA